LNSNHAANRIAVLALVTSLACGPLREQSPQRTLPMVEPSPSSVDFEVARGALRELGYNPSQFTIESDSSREHWNYFVDFLDGRRKLLASEQGAQLDGTPYDVYFAYRTPSPPSAPGGGRRLARDGALFIVVSRQQPQIHVVLKDMP
jgi:hypothetical protein